MRAFFNLFNMRLFACTSGIGITGKKSRLDWIGRDQMQNYDRCQWQQERDYEKTEFEEGGTFDNSYFDSSFLFSLTCKNRSFILLDHNICQTKTRLRIMYNYYYVRLYYYNFFFQKQDILAVKLNDFWIVEITWVEHPTRSNQVLFQISSIAENKICAICSFFIEIFTAK
jgi:hypothetical protein